MIYRLIADVIPDGDHQVLADFSFKMSAWRTGVTHVPPVHNLIVHTSSDEVVHAVAEHGPVRIAAVVGRGTLFGVQYHPEKSAQDGEALLRRFLALPEAGA